MTTAGTHCVELEPVRVPVDRQALSGPYAGMVAWDVQNQVGESPVWDARQQTLVWIDVRRPAVLELDPAGRVLTQWPLPDVVGALAQTGERRFMLALRDRLAEFDAATGALRLHAPVAAEPAGNRLNEGKLSPSGRWFVFGSMDDRPDDKQPTGGLYRSDLQGRIHKLHSGLTVANGIAWTPDASHLYFSDSHAGIIWRAAWNEALGTMGPSSIFATSNEAAGRPDGACVDRRGNYLSAGVSAGRLNKFDPSGRVCRVLPLPVRAPTMPCAGGRDMRRLFVTSLVRPAWSAADTLDGAVIEFDADLVGSAFDVPR